MLICGCIPFIVKKVQRTWIGVKRSGGCTAAFGACFAVYGEKQYITLLLRTTYIIIV